MNFEQGLEVVNEAVFIKAGRRLNHAEIAILIGSWSAKTYEEIAKESGYSGSYLKRGVGPKLWKMLTQALGEHVSKTNFRSAFERRWRLSQNSCTVEDSKTSGRYWFPCTPSLCQDWGEAIDVSAFYGRKHELAILEKWIVQDRCRIVSVSGMGGIGKSAIALKFAQLLQPEFEYVIWRSLRNAPALKDILAELIQFFGQQQPIHLPKTVGGRILRFMEYLLSYRCLVILDNTESILKCGDARGSYQEGYESYGHLLDCIAETPHQSCLVLTSREKPKGLAAKEGENLPIRSLQLGGLHLAEGRKIFQLKGKFTGSKSEWKSVITYYAGNPLALKIVATGILDFFDGNLSHFIDFCQQKPLIFDEIRDILESQFNRLTNSEKFLMYWLAINQEPVSLKELQEYFLPQKLQSELLETLVSLLRRSLIEKIAAKFTQQPVVMEYVKQRFLDLCYQEIAQEKAEFLNSHTLVKATAKDYVQENQLRLILESILSRLRGVEIASTQTKLAIPSLKKLDSR